jgi:hypothetical protein
MKLQSRRDRMWRGLLRGLQIDCVREISGSFVVAKAIALWRLAATTTTTGAGGLEGNNAG